MIKYIYDKKYNSLKELVKAIHDIYDKLYNLDIKGKKDSEEYKRLYDALVLATEIESTKYFKNSEKNKDMVCDLYFFIKSKNIASNILNPYNMDDEIRIYNNLYEKAKIDEIARDEEKLTEFYICFIYTYLSKIRNNEKLYKKELYRFSFMYPGFERILIEHKFNNIYNVNKQDEKINMGFQANNYMKSIFDDIFRHVTYDKDEINDKYLGFIDTLAEFVDHKNFNVYKTLLEANNIAVNEKNKTKVLEKLNTYISNK